MIFKEFDKSEKEFAQVSDLIQEHLSEPYSVYVYWYFFNDWPQYRITIREESKPDELVGVIVSKVEPHAGVRMRGYIGMLVIDPKYRGQGLAQKLVQLSIEKMVRLDNIDEVMLETEVINKAALNLYEGLGFMRTKRLYRYYLNTHDAFRLILPLTEKSGVRISFLPPLPNNS